MRDAQLIVKIVVRHVERIEGWAGLRAVLQIQYECILSYLTSRLEIFFCTYMQYVSD